MKKVIKAKGKIDTEIIFKIAERAVDILKTDRPKMFFVIDLTYCNVKYPLQLQELLDAPDFDFIHDVVGISNNLNHETYELENQFVPRYSKHN